jgi:hypothetical protein
MPSSNLRIVLKIVCASGTLRRVCAQKEKGLASFCVFHTKNYKVQTLAATSIVIILFTEPTFPDIKCRLSRCSQVFNEYKSRNVTLHEKGGSQRIISRVLEQDLTQVLTSN